MDTPLEKHVPPVADLEAQNAELRADKERLYRLLEQSQENLAREQSLRTRLAPPEPQSRPNHEPKAEVLAAEPPGAEAWQVGSKNLTFWQRIWKRY